MLTTPGQHLRERHGPGLTLGADCDLADDLTIELDRDAVLVIGDRVSIRRGTTIQVHRSATVVLGDDVAIGENVFISSMVGIRLGDGCALSNMVDLHDHNHRPRTAEHTADGELVPWAGGFVGAPIVIEPGSLISNKATATAGVRIGHNAIVGANAAANRSIPPDSVAAGVPATVRKTFTGAPVPIVDDRRTLTLGWFGTSIMAHLEGYNAPLLNQANLPEIGSKVTVEEWRPRGYVHALHLELQAEHPHLSIDFDNRGEGGATSRDIATIVEHALHAQGRNYDAVFLGCGINDVWRKFQGRDAEAVDPDEFAIHYDTMLGALTSASRRVVVLSETPFGPIEAPETVARMNSVLAGYNAAARHAAERAGAVYVDLWTPFATAARHLATAPKHHLPGGRSLWSDGVHLSELGDALVRTHLACALREIGLVAELADYPLMDRDRAVEHYRPMFEPHRP